MKEAQQFWEKNDPQYKHWKEEANKEERAVELQEQAEVLAKVMKDQFDQTLSALSPPLSLRHRRFHSVRQVVQTCLLLLMEDETSRWSRNTMGFRSCSQVTWSILLCCRQWVALALSWCVVTVVASARGSVQHGKLVGASSIRTVGVSCGHREGFFSHVASIFPDAHLVPERFPVGQEHNSEPRRARCGVHAKICCTSASGHILWYSFWLSSHTQVCLRVEVARDRRVDGCLSR